MTALEKASITNPPVDPFPLFDVWYEEAMGHPEIKYAAAVCLSTVDLEGLPDGRIVLLKIYDRDGFVFFTDAESTKGRSLLRFPQAAMTFYWGPLDRQIRIGGSVEKADDEVSDQCFTRRPRGSQITTWASQQSRVLNNPAELERRVASSTERFADQDPVPRPPYWQAYRLEPRTLEFWEAKSNRLHDRLVYSRDPSGEWTTRRLYP